VVRSQPVVRAATEADLNRIVELGARERGDLIDAEAGRTHLSVFEASGGRVFVAEDGDIVAFLLVRVVEPHLFSRTSSAIIDAIYVAPPARRHGIGHALIAMVAALAAEVDAPYIYASPPAGDRGMQRFLARLGFAPVAGHRVVATPTLLRRLGEEAPTASSQELRGRLGTRNSLDELIARRRRARSGGLPTGPLDLRAVRGPGV
jgi:GNAT superfamily N-acetyltransferase